MVFGNNRIIIVLPTFSHSWQELPVLLIEPKSKHNKLTIVCHGKEALCILFRFPSPTTELPISSLNVCYTLLKFMQAQKELFLSQRIGTSNYDFQSTAHIKPL